MTLGTRYSTLGTAVEMTRPLWTAAILPFFLFGEGRYIPLGLAVLLALWIVAGVGTSNWWRRSGIDVCLAVFLLMLPVTLAITPFPDLTREHLGYFLAEMACFASTATWANTERRLTLVAWGLVGAGCLAALSAPFIMEQTGRLFSAPSPGNPLALSETIQKNVMGGMLVMILPVALGLLAGAWGDDHRRGARAGALAATVLIAAGIAFTQSRGSYIAGLVAILILLSMRPNLLPIGRQSAVGSRQSAVSAYRLLAPALCLLLTALSLWAALSGQLDLLTSKFLQADTAGDLVIRGEIWSRAAQALHDYPLTGVGLGAFRSVIPTLYPYVLSDPARVHHAHNLYLQTGADLGVPGMASFLALVISLAVFAFAAHRRWTAAANPTMAWLTAGCLAALVAMLAHGFLDAVTWGTKPAFLAWSVLGLLLASALTARRKAEPGEESAR